MLYAPAQRRAMEACKPSFVINVNQDASVTRNTGLRQEV